MEQQIPVSISPLTWLQSHGRLHAGSASRSSPAAAEDSALRCVAGEGSGLRLGQSRAGLLV